VIFLNLSHLSGEYLSTRREKSPVGGDGEKLIDYGMICSLVSSRTRVNLRGKSAGKMEKTWRFRLKSRGIEEREKR
jgi:hypothetical protein